MCVSDVVCVCVYRRVCCRERPLLPCICVTKPATACLALHRDAYLAEFRAFQKIGPHPNVVTYYKAWQQSGTSSTHGDAEALVCVSASRQPLSLCRCPCPGYMYMQMEFCERGSLAGLRREFDRSFPESALWTIIRSVASVRVRR